MFNKRSTPPQSQSEHKKEGLPIPVWFIAVIAIAILAAVFGPSLISLTTIGATDTANSGSSDAGGNGIGTEQVLAGDGSVIPSKTINGNDEGIIVSYGQPALVDNVEVQLDLLKRQKRDTVYISNIEFIGDDKIVFYICSKENYVTVATLHGSLRGGENIGNLGGSEAFVGGKGMNRNVPENGFVMPARTKVKAEMSLQGLSLEKVKKIRVYIGNY